MCVTDGPSRSYISDAVQIWCGLPRQIGLNSPPIKTMAVPGLGGGCVCVVGGVGGEGGGMRGL